MIHVTCPECSTKHVVEEGTESVACECGMTFLIAGGSEATQAPPPRQATARPHRPSPSRGGIGDLMSVVTQGPSSGPQRSLWAGLLLILLSFSVKQGIISLASFNTGSALQGPKLMLQQEADMAGLSPWEDEDRLNRIRDRYQDRIQDAQEASVKGGAKALTKLQWFFYAKLILDIGKLLGVFLVVFASMQIVSDEDQPGALKQYATVCSGVVLLASLFGGLLALLG